MAEFNLIDEPWIPCIDLNGTPAEYGIRDTLLKSHELCEICNDSPLVTVSIHRLLLALLYRILNGPNDFAGWEQIYIRNAFDQEAIQNYLTNWKKRFDLFSEKYPFFQMANFNTAKAVSVNRLATECASGNNATLFDHCNDDKEVRWSPARAAKQLIACQSFALGFGRSGNATINKGNESLPYFADAIALRGMTIWLQGKNLFETLMINLVPTENKGDKSSPPWELNNSNEYRDRFEGRNRKAISSKGIVDLLTWQSRLIRLIIGNSVISKMYYAQGRSADKAANDPMKVYRISKEEGILPRPISSNKSTWRDVHSILMIPSDGSNERRPESFNLIAQAQSREVIDQKKQFIIRIVGLATAPGKAGKFLLWRHERMPIPAQLLGDANLIERLGGLLENAEQASRELHNRIRRIAKLYLSPSAESAGARQPDQNEVKKVIETIDPCSPYWARLEKHFFALLENLRNDWDEDENGWKPDDQQTATQTWRNHVKREARLAMEESIRSLGTTARTIQAVARVRTDFKDTDLAPQPQKAAGTKMKGGKKK